jgi:hypothetical protein
LLLELVGGFAWPETSLREGDKNIRNNATTPLKECHVMMPKRRSPSAIYAQQHATSRQWQQPRRARARRSSSDGRLKGLEVILEPS